VVKQVCQLAVEAKAQQEGVSLMRMQPTNFQLAPRQRSCTAHWSLHCGSAHALQGAKSIARQKQTCMSKHRAAPQARRVPCAGQPGPAQAAQRAARMHRGAAALHAAAASA